MELSRKGLALGLAGVGLAGLLAGGIGIAAAQTSRPGGAQGPGSSMPCLDDDDFGGRRGMGAGQGTVFAAAARYLGLDTDQLRDRLRDGQSLADVARARGKSVSGLKAAMVAAMKARAGSMMDPDGNGTGRHMRGRYGMGTMHW